MLKRNIKILDFDIEARPLTYWADRPSTEITAIASCWADDPESMEVKLLGIDEPETILNSFVARYNEADIVTGHYIRKFDLPTINGALMEYGLPLLGPKMTVDTRLDMYKKGDIPATQEFLGFLFDLAEEKYHMTQNKWRRANRLTKDGIEETRKRVTTDVIEHMALRPKMVELGLLTGPKKWNP